MFCIVLNISEVFRNMWQIMRLSKIQFLNNSLIISLDAIINVPNCKIKFLIIVLAFKHNCISKFNHKYGNHLVKWY